MSASKSQDGTNKKYYNLLFRYWAATTCWGQITSWSRLTTVGESTILPSLQYTVIMIMIMIMMYNYEVDQSWYFYNFSESRPPGGLGHHRWGSEVQWRSLDNRSWGQEQHRQSADSYQPQRKRIQTEFFSNTVLMMYSKYMSFVTFILL